MVISFPLMIRFSDGRSAIGESWLNHVHFSNAFCFQKMFLFGIHVLNMSINHQNEGTCKEDLTTTRLELCFEVSKSMTTEESIDFARKVESYITLLLAKMNVNPQNGFNYTEVDWLNFHMRNSLNDFSPRVLLTAKMITQVDLGIEKWNVAGEYDNIIFSNYYNGIRANSIISKYFHWFLIIEVIEHSKLYSREFTELLFTQSEIDIIVKSFKGNEAKSNAIKSLKSRTVKSRKRKLYEILRIIGVTEYSIYDEKNTLTEEIAGKILDYRNSLFHRGKKIDELFMWHHFFPIIRDIVDLLLRNSKLLD